MVLTVVTEIRLPRYPPASHPCNRWNVVEVEEFLTWRLSATVTMKSTSPWPFIRSLRLLPPLLSLHDLVHSIPIHPPQFASFSSHHDILIEITHLVFQIMISRHRLPLHVLLYFILYNMFTAFVDTHSQSGMSLHPCSSYCPSLSPLCI